MKSKFGVILLCAAIVMSLCACRPLNIHSDGNGGNNSASGVISVGFVVEDASSASEGSITISDPTGDDILNGDVIFQYKAIPGSTSANEVVGSTGDKWTELPSVFTGLGKEFKMDFSAGEWTFDLQGVDKKDSTAKYKLSEQVKANITSSLKDNIIFRVKALNTGDGEGTIQLDITGQGKGNLQVGFFSMEDEGDNENLPDLRKQIKGDPDEIIDCKPITGSGNDAYETYFKDSIKRPSGIYTIAFRFFNDKTKTQTVMGPYDITVAAGKTTTVTGLIALESEFETYLISPDSGEAKYKARFIIGTAEEHYFDVHESDIYPKKAEAAAGESMRDAKAEIIEKFRPNIDERYILIKLEPCSNSTIKRESEEVFEIVFETQTGHKQEFNLDAVLDIPIADDVKSNTYKMYAYKIFDHGDGSSTYAIPESIWDALDDKYGQEYSPERNITLRRTILSESGNISDEVVIAESKTIALLFSEKYARPAVVERPVEYVK